MNIHHLSEDILIHFVRDVLSKSDLETVLVLLVMKHCIVCLTPCLWLARAPHNCSLIGGHSPLSRCVVLAMLWQISADWELLHWHWNWHTQAPLRGMVNSTAIISVAVSYKGCHWPISIFDFTLWLVKTFIHNILTRHAHFDLKTAWQQWLDFGGVFLNLYLYFT